MASAISEAMLSGRTLGEIRTASVGWIESVMTSFSIGEAATRATAPPDSTPCVM